MKFLATVLLGTLTGLLFCEGVTRCFAGRIFSLSDPHVRFDPELGWVQQAGVTQTRRNELGQQVVVAGSTLGIREPPAPQRFKDREVVMVLGDSVTAGTQVHFEDTWSAQLQRKLHQRHPDLEVVNAGVDRYDLAQEYRLGCRLWGRLHPRHVVVGLYLGNDILDYEHDAQARPPWEPADLVVWLHEHSYFFDLAMDARSAVQRWRRPTSPPAPVERTRWVLHSVPGFRWLSPEARTRIREQFAARDLMPVLRGGPDAERRIAATERMLRGLVGLVQDRDAGFTLVLLPVKQEVIPAQRAEWMALQGLTQEDIERPRRRLLEWAAHERIEAIDVAPTLESQPRPEELYWPVDLHMTPRGQAVVAEAVAPALDAALTRREQR